GELAERVVAGEREADSVRLAAQLVVEAAHDLVAEQHELEALLLRRRESGRAAHELAHALDLRAVAEEEHAQAPAPVPTALDDARERVAQAVGDDGEARAVERDVLGEACGLGATRHHQCASSGELALDPRAALDEAVEQA